MRAWVFAIVAASALATGASHASDVWGDWYDDRAKALIEIMVRGTCELQCGERRVHCQAECYEDLHEQTVDGLDKTYPAVRRDMLDLIARERAPEWITPAQREREERARELAHEREEADRRADEEHRALREQHEHERLARQRRIKQCERELRQLSSRHERQRAAAGDEFRRQYKQCEAYRYVRDENGRLPYVTKEQVAAENACKQRASEQQDALGRTLHAEHYRHQDKCQRIEYGLE